MTIELTNDEVTMLRELMTQAWKGGVVQSRDAAKLLLSVEDKLRKSSPEDGE